MLFIQCAYESNNIYMLLSVYVIGIYYWLLYKELNDVKSVVVYIATTRILHLCIFLSRNKEEKKRINKRNEGRRKK